MRLANGSESRGSRSLPVVNVARSALDRLLADGPVTWLLAGDSITEGWGLADPDLGYAGLFADHLRRRAGPIRASDTVRNSGVAGATVGEALLDFEWRVARHDADVVSILFGMNDAGCGIAGIDRFEQGLETFVAQIVGLGGLPILQTPYPVGHGSEGSHDALSAYVEVIRDVAETTGAVLVDHYAHWAELDERWGWYIDPWHVGERGHAELAQFMIAKILGMDSP